MAHSHQAATSFVERVFLATAEDGPDIFGEFRLGLATNVFKDLMVNDTSDLGGLLLVGGGTLDVLRAVEPV